MSSAAQVTLPFLANEPRLDNQNGEAHSSQSAPRHNGSRPEMVDQTTLNILRGVTCEGNRVYLNQPQLPRDVYKAVDEVLGRLRGKWVGGNTAAHVFPYDPAPLIEGVVESGEMPPKNPTAFFPTPAPVIKEMILMSSVGDFQLDGCHILEPSAGTGAIADAIVERWPEARLDLVEILELNARLLQRKGYEPRVGDFLAYERDGYHLILMNPPFAVDGDAHAYITHIEHAYSLLAKGGVLVSVAPPGFTFRKDERSREFLKLICDCGEWWDLPDDAFRESGTSTQTVLVKLHKDESRSLRQPYNGWPSWHAWTVSLYLDHNLEEHISAARAARRIRRGGQTDMLGYPTAQAREDLDWVIDGIVNKCNRERNEGIYLEQEDRVALYRYIVQCF